MPPDIEKKVLALIENGDFETLADIYSTAIRFWFDNKDKISTKDDLKEWAKSPEGQEFFIGMFEEIIEKKNK